MTMTLLLLMGIMPVGAADFASKRLQSIAMSLRLSGLDTLHSGTHHQYRYRGHQLCVRVNKNREIEHIGLLLFSQQYRNAATPMICDFLERNLLERNITALDEELKFQQRGEHVYFVKGTASTALTLDTINVSGISEDWIEFKTYRVTWSRNGKEVLRVTFDIDCQMLLGCNSIELEERFIKRLKRYESHDYEIKKWKFPKHTNVYVAAGDTFLIKEMRNELFYERSKTGWHLTNDKEHVTKSLNNMLLSMEYDGNPQLELTLDKFGYVSETISLPYKNWLQMCLDDGCTPFFGIKERTDSHYKGTILMANPKCGYVHLLSVDIPIDTIKNYGNGKIYGRLYVYNPMHNLSKDYFKQ